MFKVASQRDSGNTYRVRSNPAATGPGYAIYEFLDSEESARVLCAGRYIDLRHLVIEGPALTGGELAVAALGDLSATLETGIDIGLCDVTVIPQKS